MGFATVVATWCVRGDEVRFPRGPLAHEVRVQGMTSERHATHSPWSKLAACKRLSRACVLDRVWRCGEVRYTHNGRTNRKRWWRLFARPQLVLWLDPRPSSTGLHTHRVKQWTVCQGGRAES